MNLKKTTHELQEEHTTDDILAALRDDNTKRIADEEQQISADALTSGAARLNIDMMTRLNEIIEKARRAALKIEREYMS